MCNDVLWVTEDGSYGTGLVFRTNVEEWSERDWARFEEASDGERIFVARDIAERLE